MCALSSLAGIAAGCRCCVRLGAWAVVSLRAASVCPCYETRAKKPQRLECNVSNTIGVYAGVISYTKSTQYLWAARARQNHKWICCAHTGVENPKKGFVSLRLTHSVDCCSLSIPRTKDTSDINQQSHMDGFAYAACPTFLTCHCCVM